MLDTVYCKFNEGSVQRNVVGNVQRDARGCQTRNQNAVSRWCTVDGQSYLPLSYESDSTCVRYYLVDLRVNGAHQYIKQRVSALLARKTRKKDGGDIGVVVPCLHKNSTNGVQDDYGVSTLVGGCENELIAAMP